jgi:hypothetical protein
MMWTYYMSKKIIVDHINISIKDAWPTRIYLVANINIGNQGARLTSRKQRSHEWPSRLGRTEPVSCWTQGFDNPACGGKFGLTERLGPGSWNTLGVNLGYSWRLIFYFCYDTLNFDLRTWTYCLTSSYIMFLLSRHYQNSKLGRLKYLLSDPRSIRLRT